MRQYDVVTGVLEDIQVHINKFEQIFIHINPKTSGITDRRKAGQLVKVSIYFTGYQSIIGHWILMVEMPEDEKNPFPSYTSVKDQIMKYDQIICKNEKDIGNVTISNNGFMAKSSKSHMNTGNMTSTTITCLSCGKRGHVRRDCYNEPVKCNVPGCGQWHPTQFHEKFSSGRAGVERINGGRAMVSGSTNSKGRVNNISANSPWRPSTESMASTSKSEKYVAKKPSNMKNKFISNPVKKVYFTYTDEFGNNLNDQVFEKIDVEDEYAIHDQTIEDDMEQDEEIV